MRMGISIHAAREGGDVYVNIAERIYHISIHAAREGGDAVLATILAAASHFNPRRP